MSYPYKKIEAKWQKYWSANKTFLSNLDDIKKPKMYLLDMFPYPSGNGLHVGHPKGYCATDIISRFKIMQGYQVLHPIGWDAFGLPAEQYALNTGNNPETFTKTNIDNFRKQLQKIGFTFDYTKEVNTTDPNYYRWTQWIFIKLYQQGLASLEDVEVNFCPELGTVLANEEIINVNGKMVSERGHFPVIKKPMRQWVLKITHYAEKLLKGLDKLYWPNSVKELQRNWIGKSNGAIVNFPVANQNEIVQVFTSQVDTIFGVTFLVISPEHPLVHHLTTAKYYKDVEKYILAAKSKTNLMRQEDSTLKTGVFTGSYAIHPLTKEKLPIWIGDYVLNSYGTGAIMAVPCGDQRDFLFAKNHKLEIKWIFSTNDKTKAFTGEKSYINSKFINSLSEQEAKPKMLAELTTLKVAQPHISYKLRDWLFSRQRYWGEPFPIVYWEDNTITTLDEKELPLILPKIANIKPSKDGLAPLANAKASWLEVVRKDGVKGRREVNTMPQWAGSCWYYLAYLLKKDNNGYYDFNSKEAKKRFKHWLPVDLYVGGQEHAVLHLLYARFWHLVLYDLKLVPVAEPFMKLVNQGMILGPNNEKMSKSRGNVINPDDIIEKYGADTLRVYEMFMGPITASLPWQENGLVGIYKFLTRIYRLFTDEQYQTKISQENNHTLDYIYHQTVAKVTKDIENLDFNTAIAQLMIFINHCYKSSTIYQDYLVNFLKLLNPFAPHLSEELWSLLNQKDSISHAEWPKYDKKFLINEKVTIAIQINGKTRVTLEINNNLSQKETLELVEDNPRVQEYLKKKTIIKKICIVNKIVNFVVK
ncbi:leucine--tRNA ligase [Spiroplasma platyhelix]|uniref:Leucine--tRNA ligase n=1 Tax=Spiroplasma platyhelix PALS-1 TaxID=1276218 RepID=A0A846UCG4_9MOLU|nr:leucine--tRNA ligase [Spiroplasma platyhelix]MBE4703835.1 Leucine--tRNA ligase [Spiroplasma platyhelix PALS-1]NKE38208.1 leucine--tRNA ligase [Spiroplasma platyhelix PALS-1]UJB29093.1 leucyl-tRNA synthetase [Spiroplasma platyhelix PALS-1]